jgi:hypothetical protein
MPVLACVSVGEPGRNDNKHLYESIRRNDLVRLCFADKEEDPNDRGPPSDPAALKNFEADNCYLRFASFGARYLVSGYGFVQVLAGSDYAEGVFGAHMRRHYFQIMLLAQFEMASMLVFSSRITGLIRAHDEETIQCARDAKSVREADEKLERRMRALQSETMDFVHRFRFTGVTNQLQGQELNALLRRHLRIDDIFKDVRDEIESGNNLLSRRAQEAESASAAQLSVVATFGLAASVGTSVLGMNLFFSDAFLKKLADPDVSVIAALVAQGALACGVFAVVFYLASLVLGARTIWNSSASADERLLRLRGKLSVIAHGALIGAALLAATLILLTAMSPPSIPVDHARPSPPAAAAN